MSPFAELNSLADTLVVPDCEMHNRRSCSCVDGTWFFRRDEAVGSCRNRSATYVRHRRDPGIFEDDLIVRIALRFL